MQYNTDLMFHAIWSMAHLLQSGQVVIHIKTGHENGHVLYVT